MKKTLLIFIILFPITVTAHSGNKIYIISIEKHSGIIIPYKGSDTSYLANKDEFKNDIYIEYGFGDKRYYMSKTEPSLYTGARAVLLPTSSVIRVTGADLKHYREQPKAVLYDLTLNDKKLRLLNKFVKQSFTLKQGYAFPIGISNYGDGYFYSGCHDFYLFNTCNSWVAKALKYSDIDVNDWFIVTSDGLKERIEDKVKKVPKMKKNN
ncbi:MAG: DUF2459 domain-containing protein [Victivallales bacterium]|nr:DUF2459 domain-containing protein [Victivallales bacterium]MCF7889439.1 DUF2459 domain-containing protein [Victivallales bacterium]